jgi:hypothetical protein
VECDDSFDAQEVRRLLALPRCPHLSRCGARTLRQFVAWKWETGMHYGILVHSVNGKLGEGISDQYHFHADTRNNTSPRLSFSDANRFDRVSRFQYEFAKTRT